MCIKEVVRYNAECTYLVESYLSNIREVEDYSNPEPRISGSYHSNIQVTYEGVDS